MNVKAAQFTNQSTFYYKQLRNQKSSALLALCGGKLLRMLDWNIRCQWFLNFYVFNICNEMLMNPPHVSAGYVSHFNSGVKDEWECVCVSDKPRNSPMEYTLEMD